MTAIFYFRSKQFFNIYNLQVTPKLPTKFQVKWPFGSGDEAKHNLLRWPPWRQSLFTDRNEFSYFKSTINVKKTVFGNKEHTTDTSHLKTSYHVWSQLAFWFRRRSGKKRFLRWLPLRPSWISDRNHFSYICSISHLNASY